MMIFEQTDLVYGIFIAFFLSNFIMCFLQLYGIRVFVYITRVPISFLLPLIVVLGAIGGFALQNRFFDMWVVFGAGVVGYFLHKFEFPLAPIILGSILGPIAETNFRRALLMESDPMLFLTRPLSGAFIVLGIISLCFPLYANYRARKRDALASSG